MCIFRDFGWKGKMGVNVFVHDKWHSMPVPFTQQFNSIVETITSNKSHSHISRFLTDYFCCCCSRTIRFTLLNLIWVVSALFTTLKRYSSKSIWELVILVGLEPLFMVLRSFHVYAPFLPLGTKHTHTHANACILVCLRLFTHIYSIIFYKLQSLGNLKYNKCTKHSLLPIFLFGTI